MSEVGMPLINHKAVCISSLKTKGLDTPKKKQRIPARHRLYFAENIENKVIIKNKGDFNRQRKVGQHSRVRKQSRETGAF